jgi:RND family efflux transporter MFP subunit
MKRPFPRAAGGVVAATALLLGLSAHARDSRDPVAMIPVHAMKIEPRLLERRITVYGEIVPEPAGPVRPAAAARLASATGGWVTAVPVAEGEVIEEGAVVVRLDSRQAQAAVERARAALVQATAEAERQTRLVEHDDSSAKQQQLAERQLAEARAALQEAQAALGYLEIRAPLSGTVLRVDVRPGEAVGANAPLVEIVDLGRLVAAIRVPGADLPDLRVGQPAVVESAGLQVDGRVVYVGSGIDPANGTADVRIAVASTRGLYPGGFVRGRIVVEAHRDALAVPVSAVVYGGGEGLGSVAVLENGRARLRPVTLGIEDGDWVEIQGDGIAAGTTIVTREAYGLPDDTPVRVVEETAGP